MKSEAWDPRKLTLQERKKMAEEWMEIKAKWPDDDCSSEARFLIEAEKVAQIISRVNSNANPTTPPDNASSS